MGCACGHSPAQERLTPEGWVLVAALAPFGIVMWTACHVVRWAMGWEEGL